MVPMIGTVRVSVLSIGSFKGGSTYFVTNLTSEQITKIANGGIPTLSKLIEHKSDYCEEYILDWEIRDLGKNGDGKGPICEPWETPVEFYWGATVGYVVPITLQIQNMLIGIVPL